MSSFKINLSSAVRIQEIVLNIDDRGSVRMMDVTVADRIPDRILDALPVTHEERDVLRPIGTDVDLSEIQEDRFDKSVRPKGMTALKVVRSAINELPRGQEFDAKPTGELGARLGEYGYAPSGLTSVLSTLARKGKIKRVGPGVARVVR